MVWGMNPGWGKIFCTHPYHFWGPASYTMGTVSFLGVKQLGCGIDNPPPSSAKGKERVELYVYSDLGLCGLF